jgi:predicted nucleic acid-binding protein
LIVYADTSALMKLVRAEDGTAALRGWLADHHPRLVTSAIGGVQLRRAAAPVSADHMATAEALLTQIDILQVEPGALDLAARVAPPTPRTLDALHLAAAVMIADLDAVLCYDDQLAQALSRIGLNVVAP